MKQTFPERSRTFLFQVKAIGEIRKRSFIWFLAHCLYSLAADLAKLLIRLRGRLKHVGCELRSTGSCYGVVTTNRLQKVND